MIMADTWREFCGIRLTAGWLPSTLWILIGVGILLVFIGQLVRKHLGHLLVDCVVAAICAGVGLLATWLCSDVFVTFGVPLGWDVIVAVGVSAGLIGFAISAAVQSHGWVRAVAIALIPFSLLGGAQRIDASYGEYQNIGSLFNYDPYAEFSSEFSTSGKTTVDVAEYKKLVAQGKEGHILSHGTLFTVDIPNPQSHFKARKGMVWLPPAAMANKPARLPVMVMLAGQPGSPQRYFEASNTIAVLNKYAQEHNGLAPIVVSPDQNTAASHNSLCSNTAVYGDAETYLTEDVPNWIREHLPASTKAQDWTIGGFSQGGTCATSIAPNHPDLYGNVLAVDGEMAPTDGTEDYMVEHYFHGDRAQYERQVPVNALRAHAPSHQVMIIGAGIDDTHSVHNASVIAQAAREAGWTVIQLESKNSGHNWKAVNQIFTSALPWLADRMGLGQSNVNFEDNSEIEVLK